MLVSENSVLIYTNELNALYRELDRYRLYNTISELLNEESRLQDLKGLSECSTFPLTDQKPSPIQNGQSAPTANETKKGQPRKKNQWCNSRYRI